MNLDRVERIAEAVLYEGYMLYPYRPSSVKNRQRFNFGVLYPLAWCEQQTGSDRNFMQTECLLKTSSASRLTIKVRFLQVCQRTVGKVSEQSSASGSKEEPLFDLVDRLEFAGRVHLPWQEAVEKAVALDALDTNSQSCVTLNFSFPEGRTIEYLRNEQGCAVGAIVREWNALHGSIGVQSTSYVDGVVKITVVVRNLTDGSPGSQTSRDTVLLDSLVSAHTILGAEFGEFISLLEPPPGREDLVAHCANVGTWPVVAGDDASIMLSSPIILYDHPQVAPESAGNLFDSTEIDEILSLRILTLTEEEKREMRQSDDRTRSILERTENMPEEQFMKLHGVLRGLNVLKEETR